MGLFQLTFRDIPHSDAVEAHVAKRVAKLETFFDRMTRCLVVVEVPHRHSKHGQRYHVRIEMHAPGKILVVTRNADDQKDDMHAAVDVAFADAERVLEEYARTRRADGKPRNKASAGLVKKILDGYGFLEDDEGREIYFHENSVLGGRFAKLAVGTRVRFAEEDGDKGPQASTVEVAGHQSHHP